MGRNRCRLPRIQFRLSEDGRPVLAREQTIDRMDPKLVKQVVRVVSTGSGVTILRRQRQRPWVPVPGTVWEHWK